MAERIEWPTGSDLAAYAGGGPATYATGLARWAGNNPARLFGAIISGNGHTQRAFLRRLTPEQLVLLVVHGRAHEKPLPGVGEGLLTVWAGNAELKRRGLPAA